MNWRSVSITPFLVWSCLFVDQFRATSLAAAEGPATAVPRFEGLGSFRRTVTTSSPAAQQYFDQGLCFLFAFNHDEAIRSFREAARLDPACAMAWWGIAIANGPHINKPILPKDRAELAWEALSRAREVSPQASTVEQALIAALSQRYASPPPEDRIALDQAYAAAMREVWKNHPEDSDVGALFAESLMDLRPWDLWQADGQPQPETPEITATLQRVLELMPQHPLALHLYIHAVEASPEPWQADDEADRLRELQPGLGHMVHMPSHIDVRRGRWEQALLANQKAIEADRLYRERSEKQDFYRVYMAHNHHMMAYAAIMRGQSDVAIKAIRTMVKEMPAEWIKDNAPLADGFSAMPTEILMRFGRWDEVLTLPEPPDYLPIAAAIRLCARGVARAARREVPQARAEQLEFRQQKNLISADAAFGNNKASDLLAVADHLLEGEILIREGKLEEGLTELRRAVEREDQLKYDEPPDWIHPVRHALGAVLLREKRAAEAEKVYREDLQRLPNNGWALFGLARSLQLQGKNDDAKEIEAQFKNAWKDADIEITSSCFCQPGE